MFANFVSWDGEFTSFLLGVIGGIGSVPAVFGFVCFPTSVTFGFRFLSLVCVGIARSGCMVSFSSKLSALCFVVAVYATVETITPLLLFFFVVRSYSVH